MIKAIIFDWGGVLIDETLGKMNKYCANILNVEVVDYDIALQKGFDEFAKGNITEHEFWRLVCGELNVDVPSVESLWGDAVEKVFNEKQEMFELMNKLRKNGYKIGFLSNTEMPAVEYWKRNNYEKYFDEVIFSCIEHVAKPDKEIYMIICNRLGILPKEAIFIDDKEKFVEGARNIGIEGIVFKDVNQLVKELMGYINF